MPDRVCMIEGCDRPHNCKGFCKLHYERLRLHGSTEKPKVQRKPKTGWTGTRVSKKTETSRLPKQITADYSYLDGHPEAPSGQRIAVWTCPVCDGPHLVAWGRFDPDPGFKAATCRIATAAGGKIPQFLVLAPPVDRQYDREPVAVAS